MNFLQSTWFMWVTIVIVACSLFSIIFTSFFEEIDMDRDVIGYYGKKLLIIILGIAFLPVVLVYGIIHESRIEKKKGSSM